MIKILFIFFSSFIFLYSQTNITGKEVFKKYCWGCHHETSMAFGPPFSQIAENRTSAQITAHIYDPKSSYKSLGYKRSVMPAFDLTQEEYEAIISYIYSYKKDK